MATQHGPPLQDPPYRPPVGPSGWKDAGRELLAKVKKQPLSQVISSYTHTIN